MIGILTKVTLSVLLSFLTVISLYLCTNLAKIKLMDAILFNAGDDEVESVRSRYIIWSLGNAKCHMRGVP